VLTKDNGIIYGGIKSRWERQGLADCLSPDKQWIVSVKAGNVFLQAAQGGDVVQCSFHGDSTNYYGQIQWSPDSKLLVVFHVFPVEEKPVYFVLSSNDTSFRGVLMSHEYVLHGDPFTAYEMFHVNIADKKLVKVETDLYNFLSYSWEHWRSNDNNFCTFRKGRLWPPTLPYY